MRIDTDKIDEMVLALLYLTSFTERHGPHRAWKGHDWEALSRLYEKGYICNPVNKNASVVFSEEGFARAKELFASHFMIEM